MILVWEVGSRPGCSSTPSKSERKKVNVQMVYGL